MTLINPGADTYQRLGLYSQLIIPERSLFVGKIIVEISNEE